MSKTPTVRAVETACIAGRMSVVASDVQRTIDRWSAVGVTCFVYMIQEDDAGPVKIGYGEPIRRLRSLQSGNARELHLRCAFPGSRTAEMMLHSRFGEYRLMGEWFTSEMASAILALGAGVQDRAWRFYERHGQPPVGYIDGIHPIGALEQADIREKVRLIRGYGSRDPHVLTSLPRGVNVDVEWKAMQREGTAA